MSGSHTCFLVSYSAVTYTNNNFVFQLNSGLRSIIQLVIIKIKQNKTNKKNKNKSM